jgi:hypothetical protein
MKLTNEDYGFMIKQTPISVTEIMSDVTNNMCFVFLIWPLATAISSVPVCNTAFICWLLGTPTRRQDIAIVLKKIALRRDLK